MKQKVAIVGSGNIGTDLMIKILKSSEMLEMGVMVGIDPESDGLRLAAERGVAVTHEGLEGLRRLPDYGAIRIVFDATSAGAHLDHAPMLRADGKQVIDLTPAAVGPYVVPVCNIDEHMAAPNMNMVTCGGQATVPIVYAVRRAVDRLIYAEIVASVSSRSAGPGTRANIDEFTQTTGQAIETVGGAERGKAIIILNPAEPPMIMRDSVFTLSQGGDEGAIRASIEEMVAAVQTYVPGYRLKQEVQFERIGEDEPAMIPGIGRVAGLKTSVFLEVEGAADHFAAYAGNLDIMTSAAKAVAERWAQTHAREI
ncbi:acetaldehyde dehydrogenase (acetylating) [Nitratireductor sp. StC3]|uniref:acetaldehyde dehydrogenase (acetylating) n=1 Tax=Nitratireductor sp. StC3 TaxID=2126741 RepID=UPI0018EC9E4B|nr:acetaldehyde dehydrogenase (acetylating) [Nitratireductor sp. StC3]